MRASTSGSASGGTPWPEVEHVPGQPLGVGQDVRAPALDGVPAARTARPGRGCPARARAGRPGATASSSGTRKSTPTTSAPASPIAASSSPVPTPKWIRGTPRSADRHRAGAAAECGSTYAPVVARRQRADPGVEQLDGRTRRPRPAPARNVAAIPASRPSSACQSSGSPYISALVRSWSRRRPALDQVRREGERRAGETDQRRRARARPPAAGPPRLTYGTCSAVERRAAGRGRPRSGTAARPPDRRPGTMSRSTPTALSGTTMSLNRIAASTPYRRTGCRVISATRSGRQAGLEHGDALAHRAVLGQRTAGLAHEPDRRVRHRLAPAGPQEAGRRGSSPATGVMADRGHGRPDRVTARLLSRPRSGRRPPSGEPDPGASGPARSRSCSTAAGQQTVTTG